MRIVPRTSRRFSRIRARRSCSTPEARAPTAGPVGNSRGGNLRNGSRGSRVLERPGGARKPWLLAGGLTPSNVERAIIEARPFGVDVASGVESSPGRKDPDKVKSFIERAKAGFRVAEA